MRFVLPVLAAAALLFGSGCLEPGSDGIQGAGDSGAGDEQRTSATLGTVAGMGNLNVPGGDIGFVVSVPAGGAQHVTWTLHTTGATVSNLSWVTGPGCTQSDAGPGTENDIHGECEDLPEGDHQFAVHTPAQTAGFTATVDGQVLA
jgi:hypothetical protein